MKARWCRWYLVVALAFASTTVGAYGHPQHAVIAQRAEGQLTPAARAEAKRLLAVLGATRLSEVAAWADAHKNKTTATWHYVNLDGDCVYRPPRQCPKGRCLVAALERQVAVLADPSEGDEARAKALRWVVHLVGDAFQPLHAGNRNDKGGNRYQVNVRGRGTNLHALWDSGLFRGEQWKAKVLSTPIRAAVTDPIHWVNVSCRIVHREGFYPPHKVGGSYLSWARSVDIERMAAAADALAAVLNKSLGSG